MGLLALFAFIIGGFQSMDASSINRRFGIKPAAPAGAGAAAQTKAAVARSAGGSRRGAPAAGTPAVGARVGAAGGPSAAAAAGDFERQAAAQIAEEEAEKAKLVAKEKEKRVKILALEKSIAQLDEQASAINEVLQDIGKKTGNLEWEAGKTPELRRQRAIKTELKDLQKSYSDNIEKLKKLDGEYHKLSVTKADEINYPMRKAADHYEQAGEDIYRVAESKKTVDQAAKDVKLQAARERKEWAHQQHLLAQAKAEKRRELSAEERKEYAELVQEGYAQLGSRAPWAQEQPAAPAQEDDWIDYQNPQTGRYIAYSPSQKRLVMLQPNSAWVEYSGPGLQFNQDETMLSSTDGKTTYELAE